MYMYQVTVQFSSLTSCSCLIKEWCFFILRIVGGRRWIHLFCKVVGWSVWCHPAKKQNRKKLMSWRNLTLPKHYFQNKILWFSHHKYQHHKSLVLQHKRAKNGRQETETIYNNNQSYPKNTSRVGGRDRIGNGGRQKKRKNSDTPNETQSPSIHSNQYSQLSVRKTCSASFTPQPA